MQIENYGNGVFAIKNFLTEEECKGLITMSLDEGYEESKVMTHTGEAMIKKLRNNDRVIHDNPKLAAGLYERAYYYLPQTLTASVPLMDKFEVDLCGLNERFRFYRYEGGQYFKWHKDGSYVRSAEEESQLTFIMYLNDDYKGGETEFEWLKVVPEAGMVLVFPHRIRHQGSEVTSGVKYAIRSDVMYKVRR